MGEADSREAWLGGSRSCRIRWGWVVDDLGSTVLVQSQPLAFDGRHLARGVPRIEVVHPPVGQPTGPEVGQAVALHRDYICQSPDDWGQLLRRAHAHHVRPANRVEVAAAGVTE